MKMQPIVQHWDAPYPPGELEIRSRFNSEGLTPYAWSNAPNDVYPAHRHSYHKVIYVVSGSITWILPDLDSEIETFPGDRLDLPAEVVHAAQVGLRGVTCLEAHTK
jgi:quercetin dioxygenase-like cupin family protein